MRRAIRPNRDCPVCGDSRRRSLSLIYAIPEFDVVECDVCGVAFINQAISGNRGFAAEYGIVTDPMLSGKATRDLANLKLFLRRCGVVDFQSLKLLDLGCGIGTFLLRAAQEGWSVAGLEINSSAANHARERRGLNVQTGSVEDRTCFPSETFKVITMFGVIEHLASPRQAVKECARLLEPHGFLVIETPNGNGLMRRAGRLLYRITGGFVRFHVKELFQMGGGHAVIFDRRSISVLLKNFGFEVVSAKPSTYGLRILLERFRNLALAARVIKCLGTSVVFFFGQALGASNHLTVYARKNPDNAEVRQSPS